MTEHDIHILFQKFLAGTCTKEEITFLQDYIRRANNANHLPGVEEVLARFPKVERMDGHVADRIFNHIIREPGMPARKPKSLYTFIRSSRGMAASLFVMFSMALAGYYLFWPQRITYATTYGHIDTVRLDDGSIITLNANSTISVLKSFAKANNREVWITGEAFFQVAHNTGKPFIVHTNRGMEIKVLGTSFNVNARKHEANVVLAEGSVVATLGGETCLLKPGEMISLQSQSNTMTITQIDTLYYASWRHHLLAFKDETLLHVANTIRDRYGYEMTFSEKTIEHLRFTGSVPADNLKMALDMIAMTFDLAIETTGNNLIVKKRKQ